MDKRRDQTTWRIHSESEESGQVCIRLRQFCLEEGEQSQHAHETPGRARQDTLEDAKEKAQEITMPKKRKTTPTKMPMRKMMHSENEMGGMMKKMGGKHKKPKKRNGSR